MIRGVGVVDVVGLVGLANGVGLATTVGPACCWPRWPRSPCWPCFYFPDRLLGMVESMGGATEEQLVEKLGRGVTHDHGGVAAALAEASVALPYAAIEWY